MLYCGRLAEVIHPGAVFTPAVLEVTDEGGLTHSYTTSNLRALQFLGRDGECVLDDVMHATVSPTKPDELQKRIAEVWLADPRVGDLFRINTGELLELITIGEAGTIWAAVASADVMSNGHRAVVGVSYASAKELRRSLALKTMPVYGAAAVATMRADFKDHELIQHLESSPLWNGEAPD